MTAIAGIHVGAFLLIAGGLVPCLIPLDPPQPPVEFILPPAPPVSVVQPKDTVPIGFEPAAEPMPLLEIPIPRDHVATQDSVSKPTESTAGSGPVVAPMDERAPALQTRDSRLAALISSCYPAVARRRVEEGRAVARLMVGADGRPAAWSVEESSGFPRLDAAVDCVIRRLEFVAGRRDGRAVEATVLLPVVFQLD